MSAIAALVAKAWNEAHPLCEECRFNHCSGTAVPYGNGYAALPAYMDSECRVPSPERCPVYIEHMEQEMEEQEDQS